MKVIPNPMTIGDYVSALETKSIRVNPTYQRGGGIWSSRAKSALIETIILGYPMPALFMHQLYDRDTRKPYRDVVDGQQRTEAIALFNSNTLILSTTLSTERLRKCRLRDLEEDDYKAFISYSLPIFLFTDASDADVREAFRRINSHTTVLNAEERRHSRFQGEMKWFVLSLTKEVQGFLVRWNVYSEAKMIRMNDARFVSELLLAYKQGISTVKESHLDTLYELYDNEGSLSDQDVIRERVINAFSVAAGWPWLLATSFVKPYQLTILLLAIMHANQPVETLNSIAAGGVGLRSPDEIERRLGERERALEQSDLLVVLGGSDDDDADDDADGTPTARPMPQVDPRVAKHVEFVAASTAKTNTESARKTRFKSLYEAVARTD